MDDAGKRKQKQRAHRKAEREIYRHRRDGASTLPRLRKYGGEKPTLPELHYEYDRFLPPVGLEYLTERGVTPSSIARWEIGWDSEDKRIVIPARDENGILRLLIRRGLTEKQQPKYLYTEGVPRNSLLFGACFIDPGMVRSMGMILTEGSLDAIRLHQHGFHNAVAILGTGISDKQRNVLSRFRPRRVYLMFDKDVAGIKNIEICYRKLKKYPLFVVRYPRYRNDPAEMTREEVEHAISKAVPIARFNARMTERKTVG